jgi:hypothetical protein
MEDEMNMSFTESFAAGLFVYVLTAVILGVIEWAFHFMNQNSVMILSTVLGFATFGISAWKSK